MTVTLMDSTVLLNLKQSRSPITGHCALTLSASHSLQTTSVIFNAQLASVTGTTLLVHLQKSTLGSLALMLVSVNHFLATPLPLSVPMSDLLFVTIPHVLKTMPVAKILQLSQTALTLYSVFLLLSHSPVSVSVTTDSVVLLTATVFQISMLYRLSNLT